MFSNYQEDESIHHWNRETLAILDRSLATEKHKRIVMSMGGPRGSDHSGPSSPSHGGDCTRQCGDIEPGVSRLDDVRSPLVVPQGQLTQRGSMLPTALWGKVPVPSLRLSSEDRRTTVRGQTVKQCTELQSALDFFSTRQLNGAHSSQSPSCPSADGVFSLIAPRRHVCASAPCTVVDAHSSRLYVGSKASQWTV